MILSLVCAHLNLQLFLSICCQKYFRLVLIKLKVNVIAGNIEMKGNFFTGRRVLEMCNYSLDTHTYIHNLFHFNVASDGW